MKIIKEMIKINKKILNMIPESIQALFMMSAILTISFVGTYYYIFEMLIPWITNYEITFLNIILIPVVIYATIVLLYYLLIIVIASLITIF